MNAQSGKTNVNNDSAEIPSHDLIRRDRSSRPEATAPQRKSEAEGLGSTPTIPTTHPPSHQATQFSTGEIESAYGRKPTPRPWIEWIAERVAQKVCVGRNAIKWRVAVMVKDGETVSVVARAEGPTQSLACHWAGVITKALNAQVRAASMPVVLLTLQTLLGVL